ncbi:MAG: Verru_Chthon cassette protein A, partial [Verrucomicrobiales bacterium]
MKLYVPRGSGPAKKHLGSQEKGVALITVLAIVLLMTVLITSFFTMSRNELTTAIKDSENLKARALADAAVNMAISQIREATTQVNTDGGFLAWSSQPGGIRVYRNDGALRSIIKLYSARTMQAESMAQMASQDLRNDWDALPNHWVDMNAPSITPSPTEPNNLDQALVVFPIVDPRAMRANKKDSVEGFEYSRRAVNGIVTPSGGRSNSQRLPMPVRWIYLLADGSAGVLNNGGEFDGAEDASPPSKENPIVGRIGFWSDDETCKINLNTASEGVHWDTPRVSTEEDRWMGASQPMNGEFQRYPGHPAMVSLSTVLFPNKRFLAANSKSPLPPRGSGINMEDMEEEEIQSIWRMSPYIFGEKHNTSEVSSSFGGRQRPAGLAQNLPNTPNQVRTLKGVPNPKHLYSSYDDYVIAATSDSKISGRPTDVEVRERAPVGNASDITLPVDRIQQGRFFLTTRSSAPEITIGGTPRMSLWPLAGGGNGVATELQNTTDRVLITASSRYSVYDVLIGFNTHLKLGRQVRPYYFQREDVGSRHNEFYGNFEGRNNTLWRYMSNLMVEPIPGFTVTTDNTLGTFRSFGNKYGGGLLDDVNAIAALMIDYVRNTNLTDGNVNPSNWYVGSGVWGQVTPICMCGGSSAHAATWSFSTRPLPKGVGRFLTVSEVALAVGLRNKIPSGTNLPAGAFFGDNQQQAAALGSGFDHYEIEVALLVEGFSTGQGWGEYRPRSTFALAGYDGGSKQSERRPNTNANGTAQEYSVGDMTLSGKRLAFPSNQPDRSIAMADQTAAPANWVGWGGTLGTRFTSRLIAFKPLLFSIPPGEQPPLFNFSGTPNNPSQTHIRLIVYDTNTADVHVGAGPDVNNLIQFFPLAFPEITGVSFALPFNDPNPIPYTLPAATGGPAAGKTTRIQRARERDGQLYGEKGLIHPGYDIVQSLVPNHGDFRLLAAKRAVMQGQGRDGENNNA